MANDYSTSTDTFQDISEGNYVSTDYPQMSSFITAASRHIDNEMGKPAGFFYPTTDSATRYYDGSDCDEIEIDEFVSISDVSVSLAGALESTDYTALSSSDYIVFPYNRTPIKKLIVDNLNGSNTTSHWPRYRKAVKVTGIPGYSLTPPDVIVQATKIQAVRWFMRGKQAFQDTGASITIGGMEFKGDLQLDPDVKALLWPLKLEFSA